MIKYFFLYFAIFLAAIGQIFFKIGIDRNYRTGIDFYLSLLYNLPVILGFISYGLSFIIWMYILKFFDVSYARPLMSIGYVVTYVCAIIFLGEIITIRRIVGTIIITLGVFLIK